jgi:hypothetical protein
LNGLLIQPGIEMPGYCQRFLRNQITPRRRLRNREPVGGEAGLQVCKTGIAERLNAAIGEADVAGKMMARGRPS